MSMVLTVAAQPQFEFHALHNAWRTNAPAKFSAQPRFKITNDSSLAIYPASMIIRWGAVPTGTTERTVQVTWRDEVNGGVYDLGFFTTTQGPTSQGWNTSLFSFPAIYPILPGQQINVHMTNRENDVIDYQILTGYLR